MAVVIAIVISLVIPMFVPLMIVGEMASIAVPVTFEESLPIVTGRYPACAFIRRSRPISIVPFVMVAGRIPVACDPRIPGARTPRLYPDDTRGWRCADPDSNRNLGEERSSGQQHQYAQFSFHDSSPFLPIALSNNVLISTLLARAVAAAVSGRNAIHTVAISG